MIHTDRPRDLLPALTPDHVRSVLAAAADASFVLDADGVVLDAFAAAGFPERVLFDWIGQSFAEIVAPDSRSKLDALLADPPGTEISGGRWRHVNLSLGDGASLPLLMRRLHLPGTAPARRILIARDLRPLQAEHERFRQAIAENSRPSEPPVVPQAQPDPAAAQGQSPLADLLGRQTLDAIVAETVRAIEVMCIDAALARCNGDRDRAASLLGISADDIMTRGGRPG